MRLNAVTCEMCAILLCARAAGSLGTGALAWLCGSAREARVDVCGSKGYYRIYKRRASTRAGGTGYPGVAARTVNTITNESKCRIRAAAARPPARGPTGDGAGRRPARPAARRCPCRPGRNAATYVQRKGGRSDLKKVPALPPTSNEGGRFLPYPLRPTNVQPLPRWRTARSARRNAVAR